MFTKFISEFYRYRRMFKPTTEWL